MLASNTALNNMENNGAGHVEVYKTQAAKLLQDYGYETTPALIKKLMPVWILLSS
jgi:hypothetical protein